MSDVKIAYYGDDFTGATDTLATAARAGLRTMLFLHLPTDAQLARAGKLDCIGIAGAARAMTPAQMAPELDAAGTLFARLGAPVIYYKVCSTFDSAPEVGSIGAAIGILRRHVSNPLVAVVGGQPNLRRYCVFGNLFAAAGIGGAVYRIDRHPTMSRHPVTPMREGDLRLHLERQGLARVRSIDYPEYDASPQRLEERIDAIVAEHADAVLFDVAHERDLAAIGRALWQRALRAPLLAVGPSTVVQTLVAHWAAAGIELPPARGARVAAAGGPVFVFSGSLSPITARQVAAARSYDARHVDAARLVRDAGYRAATAREVARVLSDGRSVLAYTASDEAGAREPEVVRAIAHASGEFVAAILAAAPVRRLGIAGGDTSSHSVKALDAWGLTYAAPLAEGVALCRLHSDDPCLDGVEVMLKGGQMGGDEIFERLLTGA